MNGAVWGSIPFYPPRNSRASRVPEGILTPEMSATRWIGTSFLLCSPFPFLMALEKRGSAGNQLLPQREGPEPSRSRGEGFPWITGRREEPGWGNAAQEGTERTENQRDAGAGARSRPDAGPGSRSLSRGRDAGLGCSLGMFPRDAPSVSPRERPLLPQGLPRGVGKGRSVPGFRQSPTVWDVIPGSLKN